MVLQLYEQSKLKLKDPAAANTKQTQEVNEKGQGSQAHIHIHVDRQREACRHLRRVS